MIFAVLLLFITDIACIVYVSKQSKELTSLRQENFEQKLEIIRLRIKLTNKHNEKLNEILKNGGGEE